MYAWQSACAGGLQITCLTRRVTGEFARPSMQALSPAIFSTTCIIIRILSDVIHLKLRGV